MVWGIQHLRIEHIHTRIKNILGNIEYLNKFAISHELTTK